MSTATAELRESLEKQFSRCIAGGIDPPRLDAFLDDLFDLAGVLGTITCEFSGASAIRLRSGDVPLYEANLLRAKTRVRMLCARLAIRCSEWSSREVSHYGDIVEVEVPRIKQRYDVRFENTTKSQEFTIEAIQASRPTDAPNGASAPTRSEQAEAME
jgi:hypothetical protein